jgi:anti-sigma regulatory factor (Ser/Thr protein kinase)
MSVLPVERQAPMPSPPPSQPSSSSEPSPRFKADPHDPDRDCEQLPLTAVPSAVGTARRFAVAQLRKWGLDPLADDVEVVTSELVTNAVTEVGLDTVPDGYAALHDAHPPLIVLQMRLTTRRLLCEVWDPSPDPPVQREAGPFDQSGRGMLLIASMAARWAYYLSPGGSGKVVLAWWELAHPTEPTGGRLP